MGSAGGHPKGSATLDDAAIRHHPQLHAGGENGEADGPTLGLPLISPAHSAAFVLGQPQNEIINAGAKHQPAGLDPDRLKLPALEQKAHGRWTKAQGVRSLLHTQRHLLHKIDSLSSGGSPGPSMHFYARIIGYCRGGPRSLL
jgi:hypothetical protein